MWAYSFFSSALSIVSQALTHIGARRQLGAGRQDAQLKLPLVCLFPVGIPARIELALYFAIHSDGA